MIIIDEPYISKFLVDIIRRNQYEILDTPKARKLIRSRDLNWIDKSQAIEKFESLPTTRIYSNSENALSWLSQNLSDHRLNAQIPILKDKSRFRSYIKSLYPDFYFETISIEDIKSLQLDSLPIPFVIKPTIGFFSIGVHIIKDELDWLQAKEELHIEKLQSMFPATVLDTSTFIIEEYIEGEEYAVDYYYDEFGNAIVLNVMYHMFSSGTDTSDRVYMTSKSIISEHATQLEVLLTELGKGMNLRNFPAHAEVRIDKKGTIIPIEVNPLRFGGWCTTGDVLGIALGYNSIEYFFENKKPNWDDIFIGNEDNVFSIVVLNNSSGIDPSNIEKFNYEKLLLDFANPLLIRKLDIHQYPVFGFVFTQSSVDELQELESILVSDLSKYITIKET